MSKIPIHDTRIVSRGNILKRASLTKRWIGMYTKLNHIVNTTYKKMGKSIKKYQFPDLSELEFSKGDSCEKNLSFFFIVIHLFFFF